MKVFFKNKEDFTIIDLKDYYKKVNSSDLFRIVNCEDKEPVNISMLIKKAEDTGLDIYIINDKENPKIVKIIDMQKFFYELKKAKKENLKKQKALQEKSKEIRISLNISEHDLDIKINHAKEFLEDGCKVKFLLRLKGREGSGENGKKYVNDFFSNVITRFNEYNVEPVKTIGNAVWTEIVKEK